VTPQRVGQPARNCCFYCL